MATRDYKTPERIRGKRNRRGGSGFFWFVTGAVFGAFGVALAWMLQDREATPLPQSPVADAAPSAKPSFMFHKLLPEMEVVVPDEEPVTLSAPRRPASQKKEASAKVQAAAQQASKRDNAADTASYLIQVASFRKASDAERLKAKLALLGVRAQIQQVRVKGQSYHRVRTGPYKGKQAAHRTQALLNSKGLQSIAIKLK